MIAAVRNPAVPPAVWPYKPLPEDGAWKIDLKKPVRKPTEKDPR